MANKRDFKKSVEALGASICTEMMTAYYNVQGVDRNAVAESIEDVLAATEKAKDNANVIFDKGVRAFPSISEYSKAKKTFFKALFEKIHAEYATEVEAALKKFNAAIPEDVKKTNKEVAAE